MTAVDEWLGEPAPVEIAEEPADAIRARLLHGDAILTVEPKEPLVDGWLDRGDFACLFGRPGSGKTFVGIDIAGCVATGAWWHGAAVTPGPVLYVIAEGAPGIPNRWAAWKARNTIYRDTPRMHWLPMRVNLRAYHWANGLAQVASELQPALVVIDTLARTYGGGNENSSDDMGAYIAGADAIREATGAAVLIVHHTGKDESAGARGHSSLLGALDVELAVRNAGDGLITLESTKQKDRGLSAPLRLMLQPHGDSMAIAPHNGSGTSERLTAKFATALLALERIATDEGVSGAAWRATAEADGLSVSTFYAARKHLLQTGLVRTLGTDERGPFVPVTPGQEHHP